MSAADDATYLLGLPHSVQAGLAQVARDAAAMTPDEKADALASFVGVSEAFVAHRHAPTTVALFHAVALVLQATHHTRQEV